MSRMIRFHQFGDASVLRLEDVPTPKPGHDEVLVRTQALGVGWRDVLWRQNLAPDQAAQLPAGVGFELAGVVEAVGPGVEDQLAAGRRDIAEQLHLRPGALVQHHLDAFAVGETFHLQHQVLLLGVDHLVGAQFTQIGPGITLAGGGDDHGAQCLGHLHRLRRQAVGRLGDQHALARLHLGQLDQGKVREHVGGVVHGGFGRAEHIRITGQGTSRHQHQVAPGRILVGTERREAGDRHAGREILYGVNGGNDAAFPACAAFKKHLQFFRHCVLDFTGQPELGLERDEAAVQRALQRINQMTADRLLKPSIARSFAFEDFVAANQFMETCPAGGRVVMTLES